MTLGRAGVTLRACSIQREPQSVTDQRERRSETSDHIFRLGAKPPENAEALLGAKGAALAALALADAPTPPGFVISVAASALLGGDDAEAEARLWEEAARFIATQETLRGRPLALRLSPVTTIPDLAPALLGVAPHNGDAPGEAADIAWERSAQRYGPPARDLTSAARALIDAWRGPRAQRRRAAAVAEEGCALIVHRFEDWPRRIQGLTLWDAETGAPGAYDEGDAGLVAARSVARRAEDALATPLEFDMLADDARGEAVIILARPFRGSSQAAVAAVVAMAEAGRITRDDAILAAPAEGLEEQLHARVADAEDRPVIGRGLAASPGAASGRLAFDAEEATRFAKEGAPVILARDETTPEDVHAMTTAAGVLTTRGGLTSHAAVVARGLGLPAVVGASDLRLERARGGVRLRAADGRKIAAGDWVTLDAGHGLALLGEAPIRRSAPTGAFETLMRWADARRRLRVRANADTPLEVENAARLGVDGVGLCRTEHMFFAPERITAMRRMIMADDEAERRAALDQLLPMQKADFERVFEIVLRAAGPDAPATIRLLDPPLHEFLPRDKHGVSALAKIIGASVEKVQSRAQDLREENPMLGKRGCRVGVAYPEIYEMQARAIFEAALAVGARLSAELGRPVRPKIEIMVPLVSAARELELLKSRIDAVAEEIIAEETHGADQALDYSVGIMVETPRAALRADALAPNSHFFSFGTNDLTQMTYGLSRDDAGQLMRAYVERGVFEADPFASLDQEGVGELIRLGAERGRAVRPDLVLGICGEHGGHPSTIAFCEDAGFDYVSCSPYRAPIARLAAAQAAIRADRRRAQEEDRG